MKFLVKFHPDSGSPNLFEVCSLDQPMGTQCKDLDSKLLGLKWVGSLHYIGLSARLYHWGKSTVIGRLAKAGISPEEFAEYMDKVTASALGPGFYCGLDPLTYVDFGDNLLVLEVTKPLLLAPVQFNPGMNSSQLRERNKALLAAGVGAEQDLMHANIAVFKFEG